MCDLAKGEAEQFDVIASNSHSEGLSVFQGQVQNTEISDSVGLGIRVIKDGRPGYAHTERLTKEAIAQTIKDALCHTQWTEKVDFELPAPAKIPADYPDYNPALESLTLAELKDFCIELEKETFAFRLLQTTRDFSIPKRIILYRSVQVLSRFAMESAS